MTFQALTLKRQTTCHPKAKIAQITSEIILGLPDYLGKQVQVAQIAQISQKCESKPILTS